MATRNYFNVDDCIRELNRIHAIMKRHYPAQIDAGKLDPLTADNRIKVIAFMLNMFYSAKKAGERAAQRKLKGLLIESK